MTRSQKGIARWFVLSTLVLACACSNKPRRHAPEDDEEPARRAPVTASATQSASAIEPAPTETASTRALGPMRPPPLVTKTYRATACRYGAFSLKYARAAYLASLGGKEPSVKLTPRFGAEDRPPIPAGSSKSPAAPPPIARLDRFLRHCGVALSVKEAQDPDLDPVLKEFSEFAMPLARVLQEASAYYAKDMFKKDDCAQGRIYHRCLTGSGTCAASGSGSSAGTVSDAFAHLDAKLLAFAAAVDRYRAAHPIDKAGYSEPRRLGDSAVQDANVLLLSLDGADLATATSTIAKLEATKKALDGLGDTTEDAHAWGKGFVPQLGFLIDRAKEVAGKGTPIAPEEMAAVISLHSRVLEKDYSSLQRALRGPTRTRIPTARPTIPSAGPDDAAEPDPP